MHAEHTHTVHAHTLTARADTLQSHAVHESSDTDTSTNVQKDMVFWHMHGYVPTKVTPFSFLVSHTPHCHTRERFYASPPAVLSLSLLKRAACRYVHNQARAGMATPTPVRLF